MKAIGVLRPVDPKYRVRSGLRPKRDARRRRTAPVSGAWPEETVLRGRAYRYLLIAGSLGFAALVGALGSFHQ